MTTTSPARLRSQPIITVRRGNRSARPDSVSPPTNRGTLLAAKVTAASSAEWVWHREDLAERGPGNGRGLELRGHGESSLKPRRPSSGRWRHPVSRMAAPDVRRPPAIRPLPSP
jgi:hypothetical protein